MHRISKSGAAGWRRRLRRGFTLIELLLVIIVISIALGVAMPHFVHSIRGHRLRTASRALVTVARFARSMAILKQSDLTIVFNLDTGQVDLVSTNTALPRFTRVVEGVALEYVEIGDKHRYTEGTCTVAYRRSGVCNPFTVKIRNPRGEYVIVKVDNLSSVRTIAQSQE